MFLLIDNYDSFTHNLVHFLGESGAACDVRRNDTLTVAEALATEPEAIVLSPGPCTPTEAGICLALIEAAAERRIPLLGVCLGHQAIGQVFGGEVVRGERPMHGKTSAIRHNSRDLFEGVPDGFQATRYHSLVVRPETLPDTLVATAHSDDGVIQAMRHRALPIFGLQFHPESIATEHGRDLLANFIRITRRRNAPALAA